MIRKILAIGTVGLVMLCSTSFAAEAITIPSNADLIKIVINQYKNGTNPTGVLSGVNKNTELGTIFSEDVLDEINSELSGHKSANNLVTKIKNNKDETIANVLNKATKDEATFTNFKNKLVEIAEKIKAMDSKSGTDRIAAEEKVIDIAKVYDSTFDVTFGKDNQGKTTAAIDKSGNLIIQFNSDNLQTIIDRVNNISWGEVSAAKALLQ